VHPVAAIEITTMDAAMRSSIRPLIGGDISPTAAILRLSLSNHIRERGGWLGQWHMPAGTRRGGVLAACDRSFAVDAQLAERLVRMIRANERCYVCQGVHGAAECKQT